MVRHGVQLEATCRPLQEPKAATRRVTTATVLSPMMRGLLAGFKSGKRTAPGSTRHRRTMTSGKVTSSDLYGYLQLYQLALRCFWASAQADIPQLTGVKGVPLESMSTGTCGNRVFTNIIS